MKNTHLLKTLFMAIAIIVGSNMAKAQCHAKYKVKISNDSATFTDSSYTSAGKISYYSWNFGDGYKSTLQSPVHVYTNSGTYWVCLSIYTSTGCKDTICDSVHITVKAPTCDASFAFYNSKTNADSLHFYGKNTAKKYKTYAWSFGDGTYSTDPYPWHYYSKSGKYYICLKVTDSNSSGTCKDTKCDSMQVGTTTSAPKCDASFAFYTGSTNKDSIHFYPKNTSYKYKSYAWSFGDGTYSNDQYPWHYYSKPGKYYVCMKVTDTTASGTCTDIKCDTIQVGSTSTAPKCDGTFAFYNSSTNKDSLHFYCKNTASSYKSYKWTFGDGNSSTDKYPWHYYANSGKYLVCLRVTDTTSGGTCFDEKCDSVQVGANSNSCKAQFSYTKSGKAVTFADKSTSTNANTKYKYYFGDGDSSTSQNTKHTYANYGSYKVCLYISDANGCSSSACETITLSNKFYLYGLVDFSKGTSLSSGDHGRVWAIKYDSASGTLTAVDSTTIDSSHHYLFILPAGNYLVKAALDSGSTHYKNYLPTYYESKLHWDSALVVHLTTHQTSINIHMVYGKNSGGPGFIGGYVSQGANKTEAKGDPIEGVEVILYNDLMEPIDYTYSKADGTYGFDNLAYGSYYVHPEVVGKETYHLQVSIGSSQEARKDVNISVNSLYVVVEMGVDVILSTENVIGNIYPNPAFNVLYIGMSDDKNVSGKLCIVDIQGKTVLEQNINNKNNIQLDVAQLPQGIYNIMVQTKTGETFSRRFVKQ